MVLFLTFITFYHFEFLQERRKRGDGDMQVFLADIYAYQSKFQDAAKLYKRANQDQKAMNMFTDLRMFEYAKVCPEKPEQSCALTKADIRCIFHVLSMRYM